MSIAAKIQALNIAYHTKVPAFVRNLLDIFVGKDLVDIPSFGITQSYVASNMVGRLIAMEDGKQVLFSVVSRDAFRFVAPTSMEIDAIFNEIRRMGIEPLSMELMVGKPHSVSDSVARDTLLAL